MVPALPELPEIEADEDVDVDGAVVVDEEVSEAAAVAALACVDDGPEAEEDGDDLGAEDDEGVGGGIKKEEEEGDANNNAPNNRVRRNKKLPLTPHEALTFYERGIYIDVDPTNLAAANAAAANSTTSTTAVGESVCAVDGGIPSGDIAVDDGVAGGLDVNDNNNNNLLFPNGIIRCSCNHKPTYKWDAYGYARHFEFKCHKKYEQERLDDIEATRLRESNESYLRMHPPIPDSSLSLLQSRKKRKKFHQDNAVEGGGGTDKMILTVEELRVQERHWMEMWKDAKNELKQLREDLKNESDEEVRNELLLDIEGWKKRKGDWAKLLGLNESSSSTSSTILKEENGDNINIAAL